MFLGGCRADCFGHKKARFHPRAYSSLIKYSKSLLFMLVFVHFVDLVLVTITDHFTT